MENETITKNETQVLDTIEKYFKDLYTSASSAIQEEYDSFIQELRLPKLSVEERDELEGLLRSFLTFALRILTAHNLWRH